MKALFLSNDASIPDVASATRARMQAYAEEIGELHVLLRSTRARATTDGAITIHEVKVSKLLSLFTLPYHARVLIKKHGIEIVSAQDPFEHGLAALRAVSGTSAKLHVQVHTDFLSPWFTYGYSRQAFLNHVRLFIADRVLPRADGIRVVGPRIKRAVMARYGSRIPEPSVIPISIPEPEDSGKHLEPPFPFTILVAARLEPEKRIGDVLRALALVRKTYPSAGLVIAGDGSEKSKLRHDAQSLGVADWVRFLGTRADVHELMKAAHVFVQSSAFEGYGRSIIESAQAGLPIISTDVGVVNDILIPNTHLLSFHVGDVPALAHHISALIEDNAQRTALSLAAHLAVVEHLKLFRDQPRMVADDLRATL